MKNEKISNMKDAPDMLDVNAAFDPELRQAQRDWDNYLSNRRKDQGYISDNGRIRGIDGKFKSVESNKDYANRLYEESIKVGSREDMGLVSLAEAAREANLLGDKTTFSNIQDEIQDRLIESAKKNGWSSEQTDGMLARLIAVMHSQPEGVTNTSGATEAPVDGSVNDNPDDTPEPELLDYGPHQVYGPHLNERTKEVSPEDGSDDGQDDNSPDDELPVSPDSSEGPDESEPIEPVEAAVDLPAESKVKPKSRLGGNRFKTDYWSAGRITDTDPNRRPYSPTEAPTGSFLEKKEVNEKDRRLRRLGKAVLALAAGSAMFLGTFMNDGDHGPVDNYETAPPSGSPVDISMEAMPSATPGDFIIEEPTPTAVPAVESVEPTATPAIDEDSSDVPGEIIEPQSPPPSSTPDSSGSGAVESGSGDTAVEAPQDEIEAKADSVEALTLSVEVSPGDGVTQVLAKVLDEAGYHDLTPEQLYSIYEELVTNPDIGPDAIFVGLDIEYNPEAGEYWIMGGGNVDTYLTEAAAKVVQQSIAQ